MSTGPEKKSAVVFVWTFSHEPEFYTSLDQRFQHWCIVPLRYQAYAAARAVLPADKLKTPDSIVHATTRRNIYAEAIQRCNTFWRELVRHQNEPWLSCLQGYQITPLLYALEYWMHMLENLRDGNSTTFLHVRPFSSLFLNGKILKDIEILDILCNPVVASGLISRIRGRRDACLGAVCNRWTHFFTKKFNIPCEKTADHLICGLQSTDWIAQAGFVQALQKAGHTDFRWMIPDRDRLQKTEDEKLGLEGIESCREYTDVLPLDENGYLMTPAWRHPGMANWSDVNILKRVESALRSSLPDKRYEPFIKSVAVTIVRMHPGLRLNYEAAARLLKKIRPKRIIANHTMEQLSYMRAWSRHQKVPFLRFPHGVEVHMDAEHFWDADRTGALGSFNLDRFAHYQSAGGEVFLVGGMHLAQQGQQAARRLQDERAGQETTPRRVLFLMGGYWAYSMPDNPIELRHELLELARALKPLNVRLSLRCHPRHLDQSAYCRIIEEIAGLGLNVEWSDARQSLTSDLLASCAAITGTWNGSAIMCLYGNVPVIGWMSRSAYVEVEAALNRLPLKASNALDAAEIIVRVLNDEDFLKDAVFRQQACLETFIYKPWNDPYAEAVSAYSEKVQGRQ